MALIVEDGTVVAGAESYAAVADADLYHSNRANAAWAALATPAKEAALRKATDYMLQMYRPRWKGYRKDGSQALDWPRTYVYLESFVHGAVGTFPFLVPDTTVPIEVKNACCELALRASAADLAPDLARQTLSETVGPLSVTYDRSSQFYTTYRSVDAALAPYLSGSADSARVERA